MEIVKDLIEKGAKVDQPMRLGPTPLHYASQVLFLFFIYILPILIFNQGGHLKVVKFLIEKGANVNCRTRLRQTPLSIAAEVRIFFFFFFFFLVL